MFFFSLNFIHSYFEVVIHKSSKQKQSACLLPTVALQEIKEKQYHKN